MNHPSGEQRVGKEVRAAVPRVLPDAPRWRHWAAKSHGALQPREREEKSLGKKKKRLVLLIFLNYDQSPEGRIGQEVAWEERGIFWGESYHYINNFQAICPSALFTEVCFPKGSKVPRRANFAAAATSRNNQRLRRFQP